MNILLDKFTVDSFYKDYNLLEWSFKTPIPPGSYTISVYKSEAPGIDNLDGFEHLADLTINDASYTDHSIANLDDPHRKWYYKLKIIDNNNTSDFAIMPDKPVTSYDSPQDYAAERIISLKDLSLTRFTQRTLYLLKRKSWGIHCPTCWDDTLMRSTDPNCLTCYGTGWEGGYFNPIRFKAMLNPSPAYNLMLPFAKWKPSDVMMNLLNFPKIQPSDIIVDDKGDRWIANQIRSVEKLGRLIEQQVQISKIMPDDILYEVVVSKDSFDGLRDYSGPAPYTTILPTYNAPSLTISGVEPYIVEVGTTVECTINTTFNQNDAGNLTNFKLSRNGEVLIDSATIVELQDGYHVLGDGDVRIYNASVTYEDGPIKKDNHGVDYPIGYISSGTVISNNINYKGVRALFAGTNGTVIRDLTFKELDPQNGKTYTFNDVTGDSFTIAYPAYIQDIQKVLFVSGGFEFDITSDFSLEPLHEMVNGNNGYSPIEYKVYKYNPVDTFTDIDLIITI